MNNKRNREAANAPSEEEWNAHRDLFREYYARESFLNQSRPLGKKIKNISNLLEYMEKEHNFIATKNQYERRFKHWGFRKNLVNDEMKIVLSKRNFRHQHNKDSHIALNGSILSNERLIKAESRFTLSEIKKIKSSYFRRPTPEGVSIYTPPPIAGKHIPIMTDIINLPGFKVMDMFCSESFSLAAHLLKSANGQSLAPWTHDPRYVDAPSDFVTSSSLIDNSDSINSLFSDDWAPWDESASNALTSISTQVPIPYTGKMSLNMIMGLTEHSVGCNNLDHDLACRIIEPYMLSRHSGEVEKWLGTLLGPSDTESFNHLVGFAVYFCSNGMLKYDSSGLKQRLGEWIINEALSSQRNPFSAKALSMQACLDDLLQGPWCTENTLQSLVDVYELRSMSSRRQRQIMLTAVRLGAVRVVESFLDNGMDPNFPISDGHTPCTFLSAATNIQIVKMLLKAGADVNAQYGVLSSTTAVREAVGRGNLELAQILLDEGACFDPNLRARDITRVGREMSFLFLAVERNNVGMVRFLLRRGAILTNHEIGCVISDGRCSMDIMEYCYSADFNPSELQYAARNGLTEIVSAITETATGKLALQTGICRWAPLRDAAKAGHVDIVQLLIAAGADVNASFSLSEIADKDVLNHVWKSRIGAPPAVAGFSCFPSTALAAAIEGDHIEIVRILLSKSVLINAPVISEYGTNALEIATRLGSSEICLLLRDNGACSCPARLSRSHYIFEIALALIRGDSKKVKRLLFEGVDLPHILDFFPDLENEVYFGYREHGNNARMSCLARSVLRIFLELSGENINQRGPVCNHSALEIALAYNQVELAKQLISQGCEVNMRHCDYNSPTALQIAVIKGQFDMAQLLLNRGANINTGDGSEFGTALLLAVKGDQWSREEHETTALIRLLLARGANVNARNCYITVLESAICEGKSLEVIQLLVEKGTDINTPAAGGVFGTALQWATSRQHPNLAVINYLLKNGADVNATSTDLPWCTAIQGAAFRGYLNITHLLLEHGADPNAAASANFGRTALEGAAENGRLDMVQLLLNAGAQPSKSAVKLAEIGNFWVIADMIKKEMTAKANEGV